MLDEPVCYTRRCKHFTGVEGEEDDSGGQVFVCEAFPERPGIPDEILDGSNDHAKPVAGQKNEIVYEGGGYW